MKYIQLAFGLMRRRWLFTLILIIEIAALLILSNTMYSTAAAKQMVYEPYREILSEKGVVVDATSLDIMECSNEEIAPFLEVYPDKKSVVTFLEKRLAGDVKIHYSDSLSFWKQTGPLSAMYRDKGNSLTYYLVEPDILSKLHYPLSCGRYPKAERNENGEIEIIVSGGTDAGLDSVYDTPAVKMRVVGILTDSTYKPVGSDIDRTGMESGVDPDSIFNFVLPFDSQTNLGGPFAIAAKGVFPENGDGYNIMANSIWFVSYGDNISDEDFAANTEYLNTVGTVQYGQTLATMAQETERQINDIYYRMMPIIITAVIMVLSGLIGSAAIATLRQTRTFSIFFLCGCRKRESLYIIGAETGVTIIIASVLSAAGLIAMKLAGFEYLIGLSFGIGNVLLSVLVIFMLFVLSMIIPFGMIRTASPVALIKEN